MISVSLLNCIMPVPFGVIVTGPLRFVDAITFGPATPKDRLVNAIEVIPLMAGGSDIVGLPKTPLPLVTTIWLIVPKIDTKFQFPSAILTVIPEAAPNDDNDNKSWANENPNTPAFIIGEPVITKLSDVDTAPTEVTDATPPPLGTRTQVPA